VTHGCAGLYHVPAYVPAKYDIDPDSDVDPDSSFRITVAGLVLRVKMVRRPVGS